MVKKILLMGLIGIVALPLNGMFLQRGAARVGAACAATTRTLARRPGIQPKLLASARTLPHVEPTNNANLMRLTRNVLASQNTDRKPHEEPKAKFNKKLGAALTVAGLTSIGLANPPTARADGGSMSGTDGLVALLMTAILYPAIRPYIDAGYDKLTPPYQENRDELTVRHVAYHEAGHALCAVLLPEFPHSIDTATIIPKGSAGGYVCFNSNPAIPSKENFRSHIIMVLGGRAAEEIELKKITIGPESDLVKATLIAKDMICKYGMSNTLGPVTYNTGHSEVTAREIDNEVKKIIEECYQVALTLLTHNKDKLDTLANALKDKKTLNESEICTLLQLPTYEQRKAALNNQTKEIAHA